MQIRYKSLDIRTQIPDVQAETRPQESLDLTRPQESLDLTRPHESFDLRLMDKNLFPNKIPSELPAGILKNKSKFLKSSDFSYASSQWDAGNLVETDVEDDWLKPAKKRSGNLIQIVVRSWVFFNPRSQLNSTAVKYCPMQLKNREDR